MEAGVGKEHSALHAGVQRAEVMWDGRMKAEDGSDVVVVVEQARALDGVGAFRCVYWQIPGVPFSTDLQPTVALLCRVLEPPCLPTLPPTGPFHPPSPALSLGLTCSQFRQALVLTMAPHCTVCALALRLTCTIPHSEIVGKSN